MATWWPNFFQDKNVFNGNFWQKCFSVEQIPQKLCGQNFPRKTLWSKCFWLPKEEKKSTETLWPKHFQEKFVAKMFLVARQKCFQGKLVARESQWGVERDSASRQASIKYCCLDLVLEISANVIFQY